MAVLKRLSVLVLSISLVLCGCTMRDIFTPQFIGDFEPFGANSLTAPERTGVIMVVLENLTREWRHGETVSFDGTYSDGGQFLETNVPTIPKQLRGTLATYQRTLLLPCTASSVTVEATISRTEIREDIFEVIADTGNETTTETRWIPQCGGSDSSASVLGASLDVNCGDIVIFGLIDTLSVDGNVIGPTYLGETATASVVYRPGDIISGTLSWTDADTGLRRTLNVDQTACRSSVMSTVNNLQRLLEDEGIDNVTTTFDNNTLTSTNDLSVIERHFEYPVGYVILSLRADSRLISLEQLQAQFDDLLARL